jgi:Kdo2-lipid IVA lauroyltransferase/acyltransferase
LGWVAYFTSRRYATRLRENLAQSHLYSDRKAYSRLLRQSVSEAGKAAAEVLAVWLRPQHQVVDLVRDCQGWNLVDAALARGKGVILVSPHLGCFELTGQFVATRVDLTFLYSPPKIGWLAPLMLAGRQRGAARGVAAGIGGVKSMLKSLRRGGVIGILPDQVPSGGEGVWADFFGRPAYTMTLIGRLQQSTGASVILIFAERLPKGSGYRIQLRPLEVPASSDKTQIAERLNKAIEDLIRVAPAQYLWSYNRYKVPSGAPLPP